MIRLVGPMPGEDLPVAWRDRVIEAGCDRNRVEKLYWFVLLDGATVVGAGGVGFVGTKAVLGPSFVFGAYQGRGLQKRLISARQWMAQDAGANLVVCHVNADNPSSLKNLVACGFLSCGFNESERHLEMSWRPSYVGEWDRSIKSEEAPGWY